MHMVPSLATHTAATVGWCGGKADEAAGALGAAAGRGGGGGGSARRAQLLRLGEHCCRRHHRTVFGQGAEREGDKVLGRGEYGGCLRRLRAVDVLVLVGGDLGRWSVGKAQGWIRLRLRFRVGLRLRLRLRLRDRRRGKLRSRVGVWWAVTSCPRFRSQEHAA